MISKASYRLGYVQVAVLRFLSSCDDCGGVTVDDIGYVIGRCPSHTIRVLATLQKKGLIVVRHDHCGLTDKGYRELPVHREDWWRVDAVMAIDMARNCH